MRFVTILAIFALCSSLSAQSYLDKVFPVSAIWRVDVGCQYQSCSESYHYSYKIGSDTIINSRSYSKVLRDTSINVGSCMLYPWAFFYGYLGAMRYDTLSKRVYYVAPNDTNDKSVYDYSLTVGDTIVGPLAYGCVITVDSTDTILYGNVLRTRWHFTSCNAGPAYIIEGLGSVRGLLEKFNEQSFCYNTLVCVVDSASILYSSAFPSPYGCTLTLGMDNGEEVEFQVFPNPTSSLLGVNISFHSGNYDVLICDALGRRRDLLTQLNGEGNRLNLAGYEAGIYFIQVIRNNQIIGYRKVILTND